MQVVDAVVFLVIVFVLPLLMILLLVPGGLSPDEACLLRVVSHSYPRFRPCFGSLCFTELPPVADRVICTNSWPSSQRLY